MDIDKALRQAGFVKRVVVTGDLANVYCRQNDKFYEEIRIFNYSKEIYFKRCSISKGGNYTSSGEILLLQKELELFCKIEKIRYFKKRANDIRLFLLSLIK